MELPANMMTPTVRALDLRACRRSFLAHQIFTERVKAEFKGLKNVEIIVRDEGE